MDGGFQESHNCTPDDSGGITQCNVGVSIKPQEHVGYKQLHGRYVQSLATQAYVHTVCHGGSDMVYRSDEFLAHVADCSPVQTHGKNIRHYSSYLTERARGYRHSKCDFVRGAENHFQRLTVDKGLLRETELVQLQISALLKCDVSCPYVKRKTNR